MLPFQGQQIWSAAFGGRNLTMKSMFSEPSATRTYLENYGGFLLHCGATRMGVPAAGDDHPLHGELPNAPYQHAWLTVGEDARGAYIDLSGEYEHIVAFNLHYVARPQVRLYAGSSVFPISITITNLKKTPMDLMYLAHINLPPGGQRPPALHGTLHAGARARPHAASRRTSTRRPATPNSWTSWRPTRGSTTC